MISEDLGARISFLVRLDDLKRVYRRTVLMGETMHDPRHENTAEHSWHLAMMALVLLPYAREKVDPLTIVTMALIHDIPEIIAGDAYIYDETAREAAVAKEQDAANVLFGMLPPDQAARLRELWDDFTECRTPEARFVAAIDRLQPVLQNIHSKGIMWRWHGITAAQVIAKNQVMQRGAPELWDYTVELIRRAVHDGVLPAGPVLPGEAAARS
ncbi:MAG: HD domain-containing protein [Candidatus Kerfeldbacteria bacterium]|nr:HD domain-containing protein [Candidatus Kerfeldbacteria bacterium]